MKLNRRTLIGAVSATAMLAFGGSAMAQDYPTKRITIIVPYSAGGATDILLPARWPMASHRCWTKP